MLPTPWTKPGLPASSSALRLAASNRGGFGLRIVNSRVRTSILIGAGSRPCVVVKASRLSLRFASSFSVSGGVAGPGRSNLPDPIRVVGPISGQMLDFAASLIGAGRFGPYHRGDVFSGPSGPSRPRLRSDRVSGRRARDVFARLRRRLHRAGFRLNVRSQESSAAIWMSFVSSPRPISTSGAGGDDDRPVALADREQRAWLPVRQRCTSAVFFTATSSRSCWRRSGFSARSTQSTARRRFRSRSWPRASARPGARSAYASCCRGADRSRSGWGVSVEVLQAHLSGSTPRRGAPLRFASGDQAHRIVRKERIACSSAGWRQSIDAERVDDVAPVGVEEWRSR